VTTDISFDHAQQQFEAALARRNIILRKPLVADGKIHRTDVQDRDRRSGKGDATYLLHINGVIPAGGFQNFKDGLGWENWHLETDRQLTATERQEIARKHAEAKRTRDEAHTLDHTKAAAKAKRLWNAARPCPPDHPYLVAKQVRPHGVRMSGSALWGRIVIPVSINGEISSLQFIHPDGAKQFLAGGAIAGGNFTIDGDATPVVCEGFATACSIHAATGHTVVVAFNCGNLVSVAKALRKAKPAVDIIIAGDDDWRTAANPGLSKARDAANTIAAKLAIPNFGSDRIADQTDFNDLCRSYGADAVRRDIDKAVACVDPHAAIAWLATLTPFEYECQRKSMAARYAMRAGTLDVELKNQRDRDIAEKLEALIAPPDAVSNNNADALFPFWNVEPWPEAVDTGALVTEIAACIARYVATLGDRVYVVAVWVLFSWVHDSAVHSAILLITSPERDSGKTTLLGVISFLVKRVLASVSPTGPALFRSLEKWSPCFAIDEADTVFKSNDDLREVVNSGWTRGQGVLRCDPETQEPRLYPTFAPKALGSKGKAFPDTILSRAIEIELKRKLPSETVEDFDHTDTVEFETLRRKLTRFAADHAETLRGANPEPIAGFHNRRRANWKMLLAIAALAGSEIEGKVRAAAQVIEGKVDTASQGTMLLADIQTMFRDLTDPPRDAVPRALARLTSATVVTALIALEGRPWAELKHGQPMTTNTLADMLRDFGIAPTTIRVGQKTPRGYALIQFEEAFERYLKTDTATKDAETTSSAADTAETPPSEGNSTTNPITTGTSAIFQTATPENVFHPEKCEKSNNDGLCCDVAVQTPVFGPASGNGQYVEAQSAPVCDHCRCLGTDLAPLREAWIDGQQVRLHAHCDAAYLCPLPPYSPAAGINVLPFPGSTGRSS
jgi:putative DNA primase/helicase